MNPNHYYLKKTLVAKGSSRSRKKKGLKSIPQQAKDFADIRGSDKKVPLGSKGMLKAKSFKDFHMDFDHSDSDDDNHHSHEDTLKKARDSAGSETDSDIKEYLPSKRTLTVNKAPTAVKKVILRDCRSGKIKNKRVPPKKQDIKKQEARKLLDNDSCDNDSCDI